ncbi:MAG: IclR family transcriptional regulator [Halorientalis sp.]
MPTSATNPVRTTEKSLRIIRTLKELNGGRVTEIADHLDTSKSVVHNHLTTLEEHGYVVKKNDEYQLGLQFLNIGGYTRNRMDLYKIAEPEVQKLAQKTNELASLMTHEQGLGIYLYRSKGEEAVDGDTYAGLRTYLHTTALGKAILAYMPRSQSDEILEDHGLPAETDNTITDPTELRTELEEIRERGYAIDNEERIRGLYCVAAPIQKDDQVLGAISVSAPKGRTNDDRFKNEVPELVCSTANVIELNVKYP